MIFSFPTAAGAVASAQAMTEALAAGPIHLRIGVHTGTPLVTDEGYVGDDVHFAARIAASGHGGQVVLSQATGALLDSYSLSDLGEHRLKDIEGAVAISPTRRAGASRRSRRSRTRTCHGRRARSSVAAQSSPGALAHRGGIAPADAHRSRRVGQDAPRTRSGRDACSLLQGGSLLGRSRLAPRPRSRRGDDCADPGSQGRARRAHRRTGDAPPARQPRAGNRGRARGGCSSLLRVPTSLWS